MPDDFLTQLIERKGQQLYVVVDKRGKTVLRDPGMNRPYTATTFKQADHTAKQCSGVALTLSDAIKLLSKNNRPHD